MPELSMQCYASHRPIRDAWERRTHGQSQRVLTELEHEGDGQKGTETACLPGDCKRLSGAVSRNLTD